MSRRSKPLTSGDPGAHPPAPGSLPRPAMWPAGASGAPFRGMEEDTATPADPARRRKAWIAVAVMVVGVVLLGLAVALTSWPVAVAGFVIGAVGAVLALRARIMEDVSISD